MEKIEITKGECMSYSRRNFLKSTVIASGALGVSPFITNVSNIYAKTNRGMTFIPYPHKWMPPINFVYLADENDDPFYSDVTVNSDGINIPDNLGSKKFSVNTRWFIEGFGFIYLSADNGGEFYTHKDFSKSLNLNYEFAKSRITRNSNVKKRYQKSGIIFSAEVNYLSDLSENLFEDATKNINNGNKCGEISNNCLMYALWAGEKIELEFAKFNILKYKRKEQVHFGCETRQYIWAKSEDMTKRFVELFNFATITHYVWDTWYEVFEPREGVYNWGIKDNIVNWLSDNNIQIEGRPLFWFHPVVTPDWLKDKNYSQVKDYVKKHTQDLVSHYGDKISSWEVINEHHDWANVHNHTEDQITEIARLALNTTKETNPNVKRLINNCCPWAEYAARGRFARQKEQAGRPLRSPRKFIEDLVEAGVEFDILGVQIYFPYRDLSDIVRKLESFEKFNKPIYITEIGASAGYDEQSIKLDQADIEDAPYDWHRRWDEELQADWLEEVFTLYYSRQNIKAINWYDFSDFRPFIRNGGLVREDATPKRSYYRLQELLKSWNHLPGQKS